MSATVRELAPGRAPGAGIPEPEVQPIRLNLGCGRNIMSGWVNVDQVGLPGVDMIANLDGFGRPGVKLFPLEEGSVDQFLLSHTIEHIQHTLPLMQELYRVAKPNAVCTVHVPYGSSDDAWEDPTHVRAYFLGSWGYFSQPYYWKAQYNTVDERDLFGNRVHPNPLCPWHVRKALSQSRSQSHTEAQEERAAMLDRGMRLAGENQGPMQRSLSASLENREHGRSTDSDEICERGLLATGLHAGALCERLVPGSLPENAGTRGARISGSANAQTERPSAIHERRVLVRVRPTQSIETDSRTPLEHGDSFGASVISVGECASQERRREPEWFAQLGTLVQAAAIGSKSAGLARLASVLLPNGIEKTPELGERGCCCAKSDYGYRGDWQAERIELRLPKAMTLNTTGQQLLGRVQRERNIVSEMVATLRAVKPAREPKRELQVQPKIIFIGI